jgi:hypothetical protein
MNNIGKNELKLMQNPDRWQDDTLSLYRGDEENIKKMEEIAESLDNGSMTKQEFLDGDLPELEFGFLMKGFGPIVFLGNVTKQSKRHITYPNLQAILAAGWHVD